MANNSNKSISFTSLGQLRYLSALRYIDAMVGNSSSGLIEAPSFNIGTINIGDRQKGRIKSESVIDSRPDSESISHAFNKLYSIEFQEILKSATNPYGDSCPSMQIIEKIKMVNLESILKKSFFDIHVQEN